MKLVLTKGASVDNEARACAGIDRIGCGVQPINPYNEGQIGGRDEGSSREVPCERT